MLPSSPTVNIPSRFQLSTEEYLSHSGLDVYLQDVVHNILNGRHEQPLLQIHKYFKKVVDNTHIQGRDFNFIDATARNRLTFIRTFNESFSNFEPEEILVAEDVHQLLSMICPDFPMHIVRSSIATFTLRKLPFLTISKSISIYFFYRRFIEMIEKIFTRASNTNDNGAPISETRNYTIQFDINIVLGIFIKLFYNDVDDISRNHYQSKASTTSTTSTTSATSTTSTTSTTSSTSNDNNYKYNQLFENVANDMSENHEINQIGLCIPPFWSIKQAAEEAAKDIAKETDTTDGINAIHASGNTISWFYFLKHFVSNNGLIKQLRDVSIEPPRCMISTSAVVVEHEKIPYNLMRAMVSADVSSSSNSNPNGTNESKGTTLNESKSKAKKSARRRSGKR